MKIKTLWKIEKILLVFLLVAIVMLIISIYANWDPVFRMVLEFIALGVGILATILKVIRKSRLQKMRHRK